MSGHTSWQETREKRLRAMAPQARAESHARALREREKLDRSLWLLRVECRFLDAMQGAADGDSFDWDVPDPDDEPAFALVRLDDRIDLALTIDDDGRCTVPVAGRYSFARLQDATDTERDERILAYLRHGVMTPSEAKDAYSRAEEFPFDTEPLYPEGMGHVLHGLLNPDPQPGPPWVHTIKAPEPIGYDEWERPIWDAPTSLTLDRSDAEEDADD